MRPQEDGAHSLSARTGRRERGRTEETAGSRGSGWDAQIGAAGVGLAGRLHFPGRSRQASGSRQAQRWAWADAALALTRPRSPAHLGTAAGKERYRQVWKEPGCSYRKREGVLGRERSCPFSPTPSVPPAAARAVQWGSPTLAVQGTGLDSLGQQGDPTSHPKGNRSWIFIGRTDAEAETPILWPPDAKN